MSKIKVFCFGFGQVAKYFIKKIIKEKQALELNVSSRKKTCALTFEGIDLNSYEFNNNKIDKNIVVKIESIATISEEVLSFDTILAIR